MASVIFTEQFYDPLYNDAEVELGNPGTVLEIANKTKLSSLEMGHCMAMFVRKGDGYTVSAVFVKIGDNILRRVSTDPNCPVFPESISLPEDSLVAAVNSIGMIKMHGNLVNFPPVLGIPFKPFFREQALFVNTGSGGATASQIPMNIKITTEESNLKALKKSTALNNLWVQTGRDFSENGMIRTIFPGIIIDDKGFPRFDKAISNDNIRRMIKNIPGGSITQENPPFNSLTSIPQESFVMKYMLINVAKNQGDSKETMSINEFFLGKPFYTKSEIFLEMDKVMTWRKRMTKNDLWMRMLEIWKANVLCFKEGIKFREEFISHVTVEMLYLLASLFQNDEFLKKTILAQEACLVELFTGKSLPGGSMEVTFQDWEVEHPHVSPRVEVHVQAQESESSTKKAKFDDKIGGAKSAEGNNKFKSLPCLHNWAKGATGFAAFDCNNPKCSFQHKEIYFFAKSLALEKASNYLDTQSRQLLTADQKAKALETINHAFVTVIKGSGNKEKNTIRLANALL